jgi:hypothetical protein
MYGIFFPNPLFFLTFFPVANHSDTNGEYMYESEYEHENMYVVCGTEIQMASSALTTYVHNMFKLYDKKR